MDINLEEVAIDLGHELSEGESKRATLLARDALTLINQRISDLANRRTNSDYESLLAMVVRSAVVRVLRNPDGYRSESEDGYSYTLDTRAAAGFLVILDSEWALLEGSSGAYTITPSRGYTPYDLYPHYTTPYGVY